MTEELKKEKKKSLPIVKIVTLFILLFVFMTIYNFINNIQKTNKKISNNMEFVEKFIIDNSLPKLNSYTKKTAPNPDGSLFTKISGVDKNGNKIKIIVNMDFKGNQQTLDYYQKERLILKGIWDKNKKNWITIKLFPKTN